MQNNSDLGLTSRQLQGIINEVGKVLKVQADRKRENITKGKQIINPQNLVDVNPTTFGPFYFGNTYAAAPFIGFGQVRVPNQTAGSLIVQPFVDSWTSSSGGVIGFTLGVYALTSIPLGLTQHIITWIATGKASLYKANNTNEKWSSSYNLNKAIGLALNDGSLEKNY